jgi:hypothetical protein
MFNAIIPCLKRGCTFGLFCLSYRLCNNFDGITDETSYFSFLSILGLWINEFYF